jgi:uncharacterized transporter YbjL
MAHFLLGVGLGSGSSGVAWLATHSLTWAGVVGALVLAVVWIGQNLADRHP